MKKRILKITLISLGSIFILFCIILLSAYLELYKFSKKINQTPSYLIKTAYSAYKNNDYINSKNFNFMLLGLDKRDDEFEKTTTTDTIIFGSLNFTNQKLNLVSLPRDIWDYEINAKINNVYPQSLETTDKFSFIQNNYTKITGQRIDKTIIMTTDNLIDFVKVIGGVDVYLNKGFTDNKYPNPEYIKNPSPKVPIYMTVSYPTGWNHLNESNITPFVRSRKSAETAADGGTDIGRIERQQLLIDAIMGKVRNPQFLSDYSNIIKLYNFWHQDISTNLSDKDLLSIGLVIKNNYKNISLNKVNIPIGTGPKDGVIYHPEKFINLQWVFTTADKDYSQLKQFINSSIN